MLLLAIGCGTGFRSSGIGTAAGGLSDVQPWQIPADAFGSQRLYRASYSGPEGEGSFRVTLRLASAERYQIQTVDPVGRALWGLDVDGGRGLWVDHRNRVFCGFEGGFDVAAIPLGPFPLLSLPSLLMGRVPSEPAAGTEPERRAAQIEMRDEAGRRWVVDLGRGGSLEGWTLWEGKNPSVWWMRRDNWSILSDRRRGMQVRWREVLREKLAGQGLAPLERPAAYREGACQDLYRPAPEPIPAD